MSKTPSLNLLVIVGSVRASRRADAVLAWWSEVTAALRDALDIATHVADLRDLALPLDDEPDEPHSGVYLTESTRRWSEVVSTADAVVVLTAEHNHSLPAALKNAFDHLYGEWSNKPIAWVSYGNTSAGTRALLSGKQLATTLGMVVVGPDVSVRLEHLVDGALVPNSSRDVAAQTALIDVARWAHLLRPLRRPALDIVGLPAGYTAGPADATDAGELLVLQRACGVDEATANNTLEIPALRETLPELLVDVETRTVTVVRHGARIVAAVRAWQDETTWHVGRLMVAPDHRGRGLGTALLRYAESQRPPSLTRAELSTGSQSTDNLRLYQSQGYVVTHSSAAVTTLGKVLG